MTRFLTNISGLVGEISDLKRLMSAPISEQIVAFLLSEMLIFLMKYFIFIFNIITYALNF